MSDENVDLDSKWKLFTAKWALESPQPSEAKATPRLPRPIRDPVCACEIVSPLYLEELAKRGPYPCAKCSGKCELPGICDACAKLEDEQAKSARIRRAVEIIPEQFRWASFKDPETLKSRVKDVDAIRMAMKVLHQMLRGEALIAMLCGESGRGKTSLACAMLRHAAEQRPDRSSKFIYAPKIARAYRNSPFGHTPAIINDCERCWLLVIDDLGSDEVYSDALREVIQCRESDRRPTIITTFLTEEQCTEVYGGGVSRRMYRDGNAIWVGGLQDRPVVARKSPWKGLVSVG